MKTKDLFRYKVTQSQLHYTSERGQRGVIIETNLELDNKDITQAIKIYVFFHPNGTKYLL